LEREGVTGDLPAFLCAFLLAGDTEIHCKIVNFVTMSEHCNMKKNKT